MAACSNFRDKKQDLVNSIQALNLFGDCNDDDLEFNEAEKQKREREFIQEQKEREKEIKKQERMRVQEEDDYNKFKSQQERQKFDEIKYKDLYISKSGRGRGNNFGLVKCSPVVRGRGRLPKEELPQVIPLFHREANIKQHINQITSCNIHNNEVQKQYWQGLAHAEEKTSTPSPPRCSPENFADMNDTSRSSSSSQSYKSVPSSSNSPAPLLSSSPFRERSPSPPLEVLVPTPPPQRKRRGSRMAAKFSNMNIEDDKKEQRPNNDQDNDKDNDVALMNREEMFHDKFSVLGSSSIPLCSYGFRQGLKGGGISFSDLRPSNRILSNNLLRPEDFVCTNYPESSDTFTLNSSDFPPL